MTNEARWRRAARRSGLAIAFVAAAFLSVTTAGAAAESAVVRIEASGTAFRAILSDGSVRQGRELIGATLVLAVDGVPLRVRIARIVPDPQDRTVLLHDFRIDGTGEPLCAPDPDGRRLGFPLAGVSAPDGALLEAEGGVFELVCTAGAQGKCVRFGYRPWETAADGRPMRDYFNACIRLLRADYCGDGQSRTREGTLVDIWDRMGIQTAASLGEASYAFEAGWSAAGAVCVAKSRVPEVITFDELKAQCPRLAAAPACDEAAASAAGALLFNRSR